MTPAGFETAIKERDEARAHFEREMALRAVCLEENTRLRAALERINLLFEEKGHGDMEWAALWELAAEMSETAEVAIKTEAP